MHVTPARRARYFWGNIPGMRRYVSFSIFLILVGYFMFSWSFLFGSAASVNRGVCAELELQKTAAAAFNESL